VQQIQQEYIDARMTGITFTLATQQFRNAV